MLYFYRSAFKCGCMVVKEKIVKKEPGKPDYEVVQATVIYPKDKGKQIKFVDDANALAQYPGFFFKDEKSMLEQIAKEKADKAARAPKEEKK